MSKKKLDLHTARRTEDRIQKQKRLNREGDVPECPSIEDISISSKEDVLPTDSDPYAIVNPYEHELSEKDDSSEQPSKKIDQKRLNPVYQFQNGDVSTAISSSSVPSATTPLTDRKLPSSSSDSKLTVAQRRTHRRPSLKTARHRRQTRRQRQHRVGSTNSLCEIRADLDQSIAEREHAVHRIRSASDLFNLGSNGSRSAAYFPQGSRDFSSFIGDDNDNNGLAKIVTIGGEIISKLVLFTLALIRYLLNHPTPVALLFALSATYFVIIYLELSLAALIELSMQFFWPTTHIMLRGTERFLKLCSNFIGQVDDIGQAVYCDLAHVWCRRFNLMCEDRCSFVEAVVDRMRT